ncbi:MAG: DEAD/DEAH box helicase, partial [Planctomycetes bacterium]|nr:DEAD/DEAH box helicase [Planctomycetota bacterium]
NEEWAEDDLYQLVCSAYPYKNLSREDFDAVIVMLSDGFSQSDRRFAYLHRDGIHKRVNGRKGARLAAVMNAGAIPEQPLYRVVNIDDGTFVGTVDEEFAIERQAGYVFLLGNTSWMIQHVRGQTVSVRDANGAPPTVPFWFGEAPGRTIELSQEISSLRTEIAAHIPEIDDDDAVNACEFIKDIITLNPIVYQTARKFLGETIDDNDWVIVQLVHYIAVQQSALGMIPSQEKVVFERFFDETAGMQLVIHAPFGMRINRAWGLSIRKSFCRSFDFELQALADDDGIVLSLGRNQSFPIEQLFGFLRPNNVLALLEQAFLQVPFFQARWRWNCNRSLAVLKMRSGKKVPPALQRFRSDDLLSAIFPASTQCLEHVTGDIDIPYEHPLVKETIENCLHEAADLTRFTEILQKIQDGAIELIARDTREPSPFAYERLNANAYAFLDDAPLEDRRTRALQQRRHFSIDDFKDLRQLDPKAIEQVRTEAWPTVRDRDELHEALLCMGLIHHSELAPWQQYAEQLTHDQRASLCQLDGEDFLCPAEFIPMLAMVYSDRINFIQDINVPQEFHQKWDGDKACSFLIRARVAVKPMVEARLIADYLHIPLAMVELQLQAVETEGELLQGTFTENAVSGNIVEWCERRMLLRVHNMTIEGLRERIKPVKVADFMRFLFRYQGLQGQRNDRQGLIDTLVQLQGFETAAGEWESEILASRIEDYKGQYLDDICANGMIMWGRMQASHIDAHSQLQVNRIVPLSLCMREDMPWLLPVDHDQQLESDHPMSARAQQVFTALSDHGAQFQHELQQQCSLLATELEDALRELVRRGIVTADTFATIRPFLDKEKRAAAQRARSRRDRFAAQRQYRAGGRWCLFPGVIELYDERERTEQWAWLLLHRYGVVCRDVIGREMHAPAWGDLARCYRTLEHRGHIRGGRFITGIAGEQFALEGIVEQLRELRNKQGADEYVVLSAADPLNLVGVLDKCKRIAAQRSVKILMRNGQHIASLEADEVVYYAQVAQEQQWFISKLLRARPALRRELLGNQDGQRRYHA